MNDVRVAPDRSESWNTHEPFSHLSLYALTGRTTMRNIDKPKINLRPGNRKPKGRRSAPKASERLTGKKDPYAYEFYDPKCGRFMVLNSSRGWWAEETIGQIKLQRLVDAYKFYYTDDQAVIYAGITRIQLTYFQELHPEFYDIKEAARQNPALIAKKLLVESLETDKALAQWWLEVTEKETFGRRSEVVGGGGRELFDGMTTELKNLTEAIRIEHKGNNKYDDTSDNNTEHPSGDVATDADAGQDGAGDETTASETGSEA